MEAKKEGLCFRANPLGLEQAPLAVALTGIDHAVPIGRPGYELLAGWGVGDALGEFAIGSGHKHLAPCYESNLFAVGRDGHFLYAAVDINEAVGVGYRLGADNHIDLLRLTTLAQGIQLPVKSEGKDPRWRG